MIFQYQIKRLEHRSPLYIYLTISNNMWILNIFTGLHTSISSWMNVEYSVYIIEWYKWILIFNITWNPSILQSVGGIHISFKASIKLAMFWVVRSIILIHLYLSHRNTCLRLAYISSQGPARDGMLTSLENFHQVLELHFFYSIKSINKINFWTINFIPKENLLHYIIETD